MNAVVAGAGQSQICTVLHHRGSFTSNHCQSWKATMAMPSVQVGHDAIDLKVDAVTLRSLSERPPCMPLPSSSPQLRSLPAA